MSKNLKQKFLITGSAGFFGSHMAEKALSMGHEVVAIDILNSEKDVCSHCGIMRS